MPTRRPSPRRSPRPKRSKAQRPRRVASTPGPKPAEAPAAALPPAPIAEVAVTVAPVTVLTRPAEAGIDLFQLPFRRMISFLWSWLWRTAIYTLLLVLVVFVAAFAVGIVVGLMFIIFPPSDHLREILPKGLGAIVGIVGSIAGVPFFLRWMTTHRLGRFRLILREEE